MTFKLFLRERKKPQVVERFNANDIQSYLVRYKFTKTDRIGQTIVWAITPEKAQTAARELANSHDAKLVLCETTQNFVYNYETKQYIRKPMTKTL